MPLGGHRRPVEAFSVLRATELPVWSKNALQSVLERLRLYGLVLVG